MFDLFCNINIDLAHVLKIWLDKNANAALNMVFLLEYFGDTDTETKRGSFWKSLIEICAVFFEIHLVY